jgi:hypothetical protein
VRQNPTDKKIDKAIKEELDSAPKNTTKKIEKFMDDEDELTPDMKNEITKRVIKDEMRES